jgi:preprotein translocase subunit SecG
VPLCHSDFVIPSFVIFGRLPLLWVQPYFRSPKMSILLNVLLAVDMLVAVLMTFVILMQRPKSEGLGAAFGGGVTENIFGAQTTNVLVKFTGWLAGIFFVLTFVLGVLYAHVSFSDSALHKELMGMPTPAATTTASPAPAAAGSPGTAPAPSPATNATISPSVPAQPAPTAATSPPQTTASAVPSASAPKSP